MLFQDTLRRAFTSSPRNRLHWASWAIALAVMLALTAILRDGDIYQWEQSLTRRFQDVGGRELIFDLTSPVTNVLSPLVLLLVVVAAAAALAVGQRAVAALLLLTVPLHIAVQFPKALFERPRPSPAFAGIEGVGGVNSFPSGHSEFAITFYGFLVYLLVRRIPSVRLRWLVVALWLAWVLATGFGRVALGRHWPLDVVGGYVGGVGLLSGLIWLHSALCRAPLTAAGKARPAPDSVPVR